MDVKHSEKVGISMAHGGEKAINEPKVEINDLILLKPSHSIEKPRRSMKVN